MMGETLRGGASEYFATGERYLLPVPDKVYRRRRGVPADRLGAACG